MARLHDSRHGSDADGIDDDDMPLTHEQAVVEADAELRRMTYITKIMLAETNETSNDTARNQNR